MTVLEGHALELIAKLEAATEGSRELDLEIAMICGHDLSSGFTPTFAYHGDTPVYEWSTGETPSYTTSIDAALTLVPEGWYVATIAQWRSGPGPRIWAATLNAEPGADAGYRHATRSSPALALCIAALKACDAKRLEEIEERNNG